MSLSSVVTRPVRDLFAERPAAERSTRGPQGHATGTTPASYPVFERYEIQGELGRGGMGVVFKAYDRELKRLVAIKMILHGTMAAHDAITRFRAETEAIGRLNHPNLVRIYETGYLDGRPFAVMEYIEGGTLADHIAYHPFAPDEAAHIVAELADGVESAHQKGVLHRDLKPANVLLDGTRPKIVDFGLAKLEGSAECTQTGDVIGTPNYMAPERVTGPKSAIGVGVDVYALGAILFELLTQQMPFEGATPVEVLRIVVDQEVPYVRNLRHDISRDLATICHKCLQKNPHKRYASAGELADDLRRYLRHEPIHARPIGTFERLWRWSRRNPAIALSLTIIVALLTVVAVASTRNAHAMVQLATQRKDALDEATKTANELEWALYHAHMATVSSNLQLNNRDSAKRALKNTPEKHRGWEWHYFHAQLDHAEAVYSLTNTSVLETQFSPNQRWIALMQQNLIRLYDAQTYVAAGSIPLPHEPIGMQWAHDGSALFITLRDGSVRRYSIATRALQTIPLAIDPKNYWFFTLTPGGKNRVLFSVREQRSLIAIIPDEDCTQFALIEHRERFRNVDYLSGSNQIIGIAQTETTLWNSTTRTMDCRWPIDLRNALHFCVSPNGQWLVMSATHPNNTMELWNLKTGRCDQILKGHTNTINCLVFSQDGTRLVSGSYDGTARIWDTERGHLIHELHGHSQWLTTIRLFAADKKIVTASMDGTARLWDMATGHPLATLRGHSMPIHSVTLNAHGSRLATTSLDGTIRYWDLKTIERQQIVGTHDSFVYSVAVHPTKPIVAASSWDRTVREWDLRTGEQLSRYEHPMLVVSSVAYDATGNRMASVMRHDARVEGGLCLWDRASPQPPTVRGTRGSFFVFETNPAYSPNQDWIAVGGELSCVKLWPADLQGTPTNYYIAPIAQNCPWNTGSIAWHPNGKEFATTTNTGQLVTWQLGQPEQGTVWEAHKGVVHHVTYSPDGRYLVSSGDDHRVHLWDAVTHKRLHTLTHGSIIYQAAFHPTQPRLVTACADCTIRVWDTQRFEEIAELRGHTKYVHSVAFTPDGEQLLSGSGDGSVRVWSTRPNKPQILLQHSESLNTD